MHSIRCHDQGKLLACGSHSGDITLLEMSDFISVIQPNEKQNITSVSHSDKKCVPSDVSNVELDFRTRDAS